MPTGLCTRGHLLYFDIEDRLITCICRPPGFGFGASRSLSLGIPLAEYKNLLATMKIRIINDAVPNVAKGRR